MFIVSSPACTSDHAATPAFAASALPVPGLMPVAPATLHFEVHGPLDPQRSEVESFIQAVYARRHGARVRQFAPTLVSLADGDERVAAAGYRRASNGPLFLEHYLDAPVEQLLAARRDDAPARSGIFEVGHLASSRAGEGRRLIMQLGTHLAAQGCEWVVGTLTDELRSLFLRLGIEPLALGVADPTRLGDAQAVADWGRYYEHRPMVLAGHLPQALRRLAARRRQQ